jgi:DNA-binding CsgD family transcriptional regulator
MDARPPINRLTEREKEALRAWLNHKSAKQIALDLGITHHAVEKRLKMARTKLGAGSSLEAARMLAEAEGTAAGAAQGYGQAVTAAPELAPLAPRRPSWRPRPIAIGGIAMSLALVLALAAAPVVTTEPAANGPTPGTAIKLVPDMTLMFDKLDENANGYLEQPESPFVTIALLDQAQQGGAKTAAKLAEQPDPEKIAQFYAQADKDGDGRVSFREFHVWHSARLAKLGIDPSLELKVTPLPRS